MAQSDASRCEVLEKWSTCLPLCKLDLNRTDLPYPPGDTICRYRFLLFGCVIETSRKNQGVNVETLRKVWIGHIDILGCIFHSLPSSETNRISSPGLANVLHPAIPAISSTLSPTSGRISSRGRSIYRRNSPGLVVCFKIAGFIKTLCTTRSVTVQQ